MKMEEKEPINSRAVALWCFSDVHDFLMIMIMGNKKYNMQPLDGNDLFSLLL